MTLEHKFVKYIPEEVEFGIIYISIEFCTAIHKCVCGCGNDVVTPFSPTDWELIFNGEHISLSPSIGNWNFACQSHYWIRENKIKFAPKWDKERIEKGQKIDLENKKTYFKKRKGKSD